ncbi:small integral membrane protein 4 [Topomyia yanbarensis]|uniref:small integral membrane protein 4 n=1 Tax=Topomyia yanbarensis TaxID=2498891 RepID=UPI00273B1168|nr:small integral membrane protein 4 [Topomyia yanbarensis]
MRIRRSRTLTQLLDLWPGKKTFGIYRFLPLFFGLGAALEFSMIHWRVGETNFYNTFKKNQAKEIVEEKVRLHQLEPTQ